MIKGKYDGLGATIGLTGDDDIAVRSDYYYV